MTGHHIHLVTFDRAFKHNVRLLLDDTRCEVSWSFRESVVRSSPVPPQFGDWKGSNPSSAVWFEYKHTSKASKRRVAVKPGKHGAGQVVKSTVA